MRNFLSYVLLITLFASCRGTHVNNYYSGFVIDDSGNPVDSVLIKEDVSEEYANKTLTGRNGYFRMDRAEMRLCNLIFMKEGYQSDTVRMVRLQHNKEIYSPLLTRDSSKVIIRKLNIE